MSDQRANVDAYESSRGRIVSKKGMWKPGQDVIDHGYELFKDLLGSTTFFQVLILHTCGRLPEKKFADWLEACFLTTSWPDSRIWPNTIGAFAGSLRASPLAGVCAGTLASDSKLYGPGTAVAAMTFIAEALDSRKRGRSVEEIVASKTHKDTNRFMAPGYNRPLFRGDERVPYLEAYAIKLGIRHGPHLGLAYEIDDYLRESCGEAINQLGYMAAVMSDHGFSPQEAQTVTSLMVSAGVTSCFIEAASGLEEGVLPLRCDDIEYVGPAPRSVDEQA
jgi:hypothetical protein